ncbi:Cytochrome c oxidase protein 20 mitochondrial [Meyerozyma sp. JA9]|nr:Cytochrome c oxidase protein 20 mitochondrial [Meyerozyma sp. JA9]
MGWFGGSPAKVSNISEIDTTSNLNGQQEQQFLEDLPPKFEDTAPRQPPESMYREAFKQVKLSDFTPSHFVGMPCFREAMITGFQSMGVLGAITFLIHKNPQRSVNWAVCGFFLGNIVGWEQCRSLRRKSFETVEKARQKNQEKQAKKWEEKQASDEQMKKWKEVQERE